MKRLAGVLLGLFGILALPLRVDAAAPPAKQPEKQIELRPVEYQAGGLTMKGTVAYDANQKGLRPGVLVVHEWWGHNDYAKRRARMLAELGYTALAVDMYGDGKSAQHPDDATKFMKELTGDPAAVKARFLAALETLRKEPTVDKSRIAAIGYCMGGGIVLGMATQGVDLRAVASFHGSLGMAKPAAPGTVKAKVRVYHGADDKFIPPEAIAEFKKNLTAAKVDFQFLSYPGAVHGFTNPDVDALGKKFNLPLAYNAEADKQSWDDLTKFLADTLKK